MNEIFPLIDKFVCDVADLKHPFVIFLTTSHLFSCDNNVTIILSNFLEANTNMYDCKLQGQCFKV